MVKNKKEIHCNACNSKKNIYIFRYTNNTFKYLCKPCVENELEFIELIGGGTLVDNIYKVNW